MILVDTTVWVDFFRGRATPEAETLRLAIERRDGLATCGVILTEILRGVRDDREVALVRHYVQSLIYLEATRETHVHGGRLARTARERGFTIRSTVDCIIAAVAIEQEVALLETIATTNISPVVQA
jgi:predicted nucleic acid-binding protein